MCVGRKSSACSTLGSRREEYDDATSLGYAFLPCDQIFPFLELRSAAVDRSRKRKASHARDLSEMEKRVEAQFATLIATGIRHVVLSAFGCGAFKNDPSDIAWVCTQAVERRTQREDLTRRPRRAVVPAGAKQRSG